MYQSCFIAGTVYYLLTRIHDNNPNPSDMPIKLHGIHLEVHLTFNHLTSQLCNKLSRALFQIRRAKDFLPQSALKTLYMSLFQSHLFYCTNIISICTQANINKIFILQKNAICTIVNAAYNSHTNPIFLHHYQIKKPTIYAFSCY
jgi:hypothetical protein